MVKLHEFQRRMQVEMAEAVNRTADLILADIKPKVPYATGRLETSWQQRRRVKPSDTQKEVQVGPPVRYGIKYYPFTESFGSRSRRFYGSPRECLFGPGKSFIERRNELFEGQVQEGIRRALN